MRRYQDAAVAGRPARVEDSLQCLWGEVQVGPAPARVPARLQPDVLGRDALEQPPESSRDAAQKGVGDRARGPSSAGSQFLKIGKEKKNQF